ncbi:MAG: hypothetical protein ACXAC8_04640 [Candidatus Hodarchaeales archaeon]|jgi:hypothetical protein
MFQRSLSVVLLLISFFVVLSFIFVTPIEISHAIEVTPNTIVDVNDVVILNYTLLVINNIEDIQNGTIYVHDPDDPSVPNEIFEKYPDIHVPPNTGFFEGLLGMQAGVTKGFEVLSSSGKAFTNISDPLYGEDLFYTVYIQKILLDASPPPTSLFEIIPFLDIFIILIVFLLILIVFFRVRRFSSSHNFFGTKNKCYLCKSTAEVRCGNSGCKIPYCKTCFLKENKCTVCHSNTMKPLT